MLNRPIRVNNELLRVLHYHIGSSCRYIDEKGKERADVLTIGLIHRLTDTDAFANKIIYLTLYLKDYTCLSDKEFGLLLHKFYNNENIETIEDFKEKIEKDSEALLYAAKIGYDIFGLIGKGLAMSQNSEEYKLCTKNDISVLP